MDKIIRKMLIGFLIIILNFRDAAYSLHITRQVVPSILSTGEDAVLICEWATDGDSIYAVKWYLGLDEFYRWTPAEPNPKKTFEIVGDPIAVDLERSNQGKVRIHRVKLEAAGVYRCEVSAEAPSFHTESRIASMTVVDLPDSKPQITGIHPSYQMNEEVNLNCSSPLSNPKATLTFYVNDIQADMLWLKPYKSIEDHASALETAVLGLRFPVWKNLPNGGGVISIKCTAEIYDVYWDSSEVFVQVDVPYHASVMEGRASSADGLFMTLPKVLTIATANVAYLLM